MMRITNSATAAQTRRADGEPRRVKSYAIREPPAAISSIKPNCSSDTSRLFPVLDQAFRDPSLRGFELEEAARILVREHRDHDGTARREDDTDVVARVSRRRAAPDDLVVAWRSIK